MTATNVAPVPDPADAPMSPLENSDASDVADWELGWDAGWDLVDQWGAQSFPASDPPANW